MECVVGNMSPRRCERASQAGVVMMLVIDGAELFADALPHPVAQVVDGCEHLVDGLVGSRTAVVKIGKPVVRTQPARMFAKIGEPVVRTQPARMFAKIKIQHTCSGRRRMPCG